MSIYNKLLLAVLHLLCVGINITVFFMVVRVVMLWKEIACLKPFNDAGRNLVDRYSEMVASLWDRITKKQLAPKGKILIGLIALELVRLFITGFAELL